MLLMYNTQSEKCTHVINVWLNGFSQSEHTYSQSQEIEYKVHERTPRGEMFYVLIVVMATQLYEFAKTHWTVVHL